MLNTQNAKRIGDEKLRNIVFVVRQVVAVGAFKFDIRVFQLHKHQRYAVNVEQHIRAAVVSQCCRTRAFDPQLRHRQKRIVVGAGRVKVNQLELLLLALALGVVLCHRYTVT